MKKLVAVLLTILMLFSSFQGVLRENVVRGQTAVWKELSTGSNGLMKGDEITSVVVDPKNPNTIYVGTGFYGVYKSEDSGLTWKATSSAIPDMGNVLTLAIDPKNTNIVYAGLFNFGRPRIYKTEDGGKTWKRLEKSPNYPVYTITIDPNNTNVIYAYAFSDGFYRSDDGGINWKKLNVTAYFTALSCITVDPNNSNVVYIVQYGPIYKSEDKGEHFTELWVEKYPTMSVVVDPNNSNVLYASTDGAGIFKSVDGGKTWTQTSLKIANAERIVVNPNNPTVMYALDNVRSCIEETSDAWKNWKYTDLTGLPKDMKKDETIHKGPLCSLAIDSKGNLFLGTTKGIFEHVVQGPPSTSNKLIFAIGYEPDYIVSFLTSMMASAVITGATEAKLIGIKPDGTLFPDLATNVPNFSDGSWKVYEVNGKKYMQTTYNLRKGVKWSDGVPIDYEQDIKFAVYDIYLSGKIPRIPSTDPYDKIEKIEFLDPYTMVVTWKEFTPYANLGLPIYPKHYYSKVPVEKIPSSTLVNTPVHAGPYKVKEWVKGSYISIVPNPYYYGNQPKISEIVFKWLSGEDALSHIISGDVDITYLCLDLLEANKAKNVLGVTVLNVPSTFWEHLEINMSDPILSEVRVRKAIAYGIDYDDLNNRVFFGLRVISYYPYIALFNEYYRNPNATLPKYNPEIANKLLDEAGWKMGSDGYRYKDGKKLTLELSTTTSQIRKNEAKVLQEQLKKIGIEITIKYPPNFFNSYLPHRLFQLALFAWGGDPLDPGGFSLYHSSQIPTEVNDWRGQNYTGISDPTLDDAIYKATHEVDPSIRQRNYYIADQRLVDLVPQIGLNVWTDVVTFKNNIKGINYSISRSVPITWNIQDWYIGFDIVALAGSGGSISPSGTVAVVSGNSQTFTITPNAGYKIKDVKVDNVSVGAVTTYTFENVTANHKIEVEFEPITFTITAFAGTS
ncbi:MAG: hypothetical protein K6343_03775, partial [Caldisericaceae bacterium]